MMRINLKIFRISHKMSQDEMAAEIGYERAYYGHIERGYQAGSATFWERLQAAYKLSDDQLEELKKVE